MTLDDRSLREHLDRRAESGATDPLAVPDAVMDRIGVTGPPWWRRRPFGMATRGFAAAAGAMAVLVVGAMNGGPA